MRNDNSYSPSGDRRTIAYLPAGAFNIQFWFTYSAMKKNFVGKFIMVFLIGE